MAQYHRRWNANAVAKRLARLSDELDVYNEWLRPQIPQNRRGYRAYQDETIKFHRYTSIAHVVEALRTLSITVTRIP